MSINKTFDKAASAAAVLSSFYADDKLSIKLVASAIGTISRAGAKLDTQIHATAVACIVASLPSAEKTDDAAALLAAGHLNATPAAQLMNAMPKGSRAKALKAWFAAHSNILLTKGEDGTYKAKLTPPTQKNYRPLSQADIDAALARPFWVVEEADVNPADFTDDKFKARVKALLTSATAANAKLDAKGKAALADLRGLAAKLGVEA